MANVDFDQAELELGEQPNMGPLTDGFKQAVTGLFQASSELEKFRNIPASAQSSAILSQLSQMQNPRAGGQALYQWVPGATDVKPVVLRSSSLVVKSRSPASSHAMTQLNLTPLLDFRIRRLEHRICVFVLTALNLPNDGTTAEKKRQRRLYIELPDVE
ncbi:hypothetical protein AJ78_08503 [Emergomyces pasteurianus Ep9510]|uniref:Uncharacterized protein n=1 Tax=Emergomyces pasteurianus Ep9510 TaxID=1447872 RepID=A0A1J9Q5T5_9EURO|nr:hypothetical protein AJ78_08503 [Emergomyces pasteurianus Ep9510]